ncbi:coproporphyrinogen III oxidase [Gemmatimonadetes bacterium T265]|nr:coproporphyrinogen III oxidase [Gemmatimonadetes bacterium T265]
MPDLYRHVYVHVPFCARRCVYCDFAIAVRARVPVDEYLDGVRRELEARFGPAPRAVDRAPITTLYMGGGTPSRLGGDGLARLVDVFRRWFVWDESAEVTAEANPDDVTADAVRSWRDAGITRLSIGAQTFDESALGWMRRSHARDAAERAVDIARAHGIDDLALDLIFALPEGVARDLDADLARLVALAPSHVSIYGLTVEPGTPLARWADRRAVDEADESRYEAEFLTAHDVLTAAGYEHYEVSNFARPGRRARHNSAYWSGVPYVGLGPSAHGFDGVVRRWNEPAYARWLSRVGRGEDPLAGCDPLDADARQTEAVYLGLRTADGLRIRQNERPRVRRWADAGWATLDGECARLTPLGWLRLDALAADLTAVRSRS